MVYENRFEILLTQHEFEARFRNFKLALRFPKPCGVPKNEFSLHVAANGSKQNIKLL